MDQQIATRAFGVIPLKEVQDKLDSIGRLESEIKVQQGLVEDLQMELRVAHGYIANLQTAYNECRDWFSNVEYTPGTEEEDEAVSLEECDPFVACNLKIETEEMAMNYFRYWFAILRMKYGVDSLEDYEKFIDTALRDLNLIEEKFFKENGRE